MKIILVPTDFSDVAENAINYAAEFAILTHAKLILFHAYHVPLVTTEVPVIILGLDELEKGRMEGLKKIERNLYLKYGKTISIQCVCKCGFAVDEIKLYTSKHKVDLVVMGMQGAGYLTEKIIGSVTTSLIQKAECPILVISKGVKFKNIKKIVLACDYNETEYKEILEPLKEFTQIFKSHIYVFNVEREVEHAVSAAQVVSDFMKLEHSLAGADHTFHYASNEDIVNGINEFVEEYKMDMVVMIPLKHSVLKNIFQEPNTKRMAFHSKVPLLALH